MWAQPFLKSEAPIPRKEWVYIEKIQTVTTENVLFLQKGFHRKPFLFSSHALLMGHICLKSQYSVILSSAVSFIGDIPKR